MKQKLDRKKKEQDEKYAQKRADEKKKEQLRVSTALGIELLLKGAAGKNNSVSYKNTSGYRVPMVPRHP